MFEREKERNREKERVREERERGREKFFQSACQEMDPFNVN